MKAKVELDQIQRALLARSLVRRGRIALVAVNAAGEHELFPMERPALSRLALETFIERLIRTSCASPWHFFYLRPASKGNAEQERELFALVGRLAGFDLDNCSGPLVAHCMSINTSGQPEE